MPSLKRFAEQLQDQLAPSTHPDAPELYRELQRIAATIASWGETDPDPEEWGRIWDRLTEANKRVAMLR